MYDAVYSPDGTRIASTGEDGLLKVWNAGTGDLLHSLPGAGQDVFFPAYHPDGERLAYALRRKIEDLLDRLSPDGDDLELLERLADTAALLDDLPFEVNLARAQIDFFELARTAYPVNADAARRGDPGARRLVESYRSLGDALRVVVESDDQLAVAAYLRGWTDVLTFDIAPVISDEQLAQIMG